MVRKLHGNSRFVGTSLFIVLGVVLWILAGCAGQPAADLMAAGPTEQPTEQPTKQSEAVQSADQPFAGLLSPEAELPIDPQVRLGRLENGLTYYVRPNAEPENRAELRLVVNAGSVLEDEDQLGLAHFLEHMAFNGTERFEKQEIVNYLESIGTVSYTHLRAHET